MQGQEALPEQLPNERQRHQHRPQILLVSGGEYRSKRTGVKRSAGEVGQRLNRGCAVEVLAKTVT